MFNPHTSITKAPVTMTELGDSTHTQWPLQVIMGTPDLIYGSEVDMWSTGVVLFD